MSYRDIIKEQIRQVVLKKEQSSDKKHWEWVLGQLIADLREYETNGREKWPREPYDDAWKRYRTRISPYYNLDEFFRRFFEGTW